MVKYYRRSDDQNHDHSAVFNVLPRLECVVPVIEELGDVAPNAKGQDYHSTEMEEMSPHFTLDVSFAYLAEKNLKGLSSALHRKTGKSP